MDFKKHIARLMIGICMVSLVSSAYAEEEKKASVMFASDYQFYQNYTPILFGDPNIKSCLPVVARLAEEIYIDGHDVETVVIGGDYTQNDNNKDKNNPSDTFIFGDELQYHYGNNPQYSMNEIESATKQYLPVANYLYVQGNHDPDIYTLEGSRLARTGAYEFDDYYVYILNDQDYVGPRPRTKTEEYTNIVPDSIMKIEKPEEVVDKTAANLETFLNSLVEKTDMKPVFICSHQPLHYTSDNYNGQAYKIFNVVNKMAENLDIIYFFGHTHDQCDDIGGGLSYLSEGDMITVCNDSYGDNGTDVNKLNFYYMNYGHLARYSGVNEVLSASVVDVYRNKLVVNRFPIGREKIEYTIYRKNSAPKETTNILLTIDSREALLNGKAVTNDVAPVIVESRTMLPIKFVAEALGATVGWNAETRTVTISKTGISIALTIGESYATVNGGQVALDVPSFIQNDRTYLPLKFVSEKLGATVVWNGENRTVTITQ